MPKFSFKSRNTQGELVEGIRLANSERELISSLRGEGLIVFSVAPAKEGAPAKEKKREIATTRVKGKKIDDSDISVFARQLATLINAGVSILDGIEDMSEMVGNPKFQEVLKNVSASIREGSTLSDAMKKHHKVFGRVFISMVAAGERSGKLGRVLFDMALYLENAVKLKRKVKAASVYPAFIAVFFLGAVAGLIFFLIPKFKTMFASFGAELPLPTRIAMGISETAIHYFPLVLLAVVGIGTAVTMWYRTESGRKRIDRFRLSMPIFGSLMTKVVFARFFQTFATLLRSGIDIVACLEIAAKVTDNLYLEEIISGVRARVIEGSTLSREMEKAVVFPRMVVRMAAVGEKSGQLDDMFAKLSDYYGDEVDAVVASMSSIIEPVLIVGLGLVVGVFVVVMYLPIFRMGMAVMGQ